MHVLCETNQDAHPEVIIVILMVVIARCIFSLYAKTFVCASGVVRIIKNGQPEAVRAFAKLRGRSRPSSEITEPG